MICPVSLVCKLAGSEIIGLQWQDVDLEQRTIQLRRGVVNQEISELKTIGSRRALPIPAVLADALREWQKQTSFRRPGDWLFASPQSMGKRPYWPGMLLRRHVQPAAKRLGINKRVGWHTFRRSFATLLYANEKDVKTTQELLRHSNPGVSMGVYAQAVTEEKRKAQEKLATLILEAEPELEAEKVSA